MDQKSSVAGPSSYNGELTPGNKFINELNKICQTELIMNLSELEKEQMKKVIKKCEEASKLSEYVLDFNELLIRLDKRGEILEKIMMSCCQYLTHLTIIGFQYPWMSNVLKNNCQNISQFSIDMKDIDEYKIPDEDLVEIIKSMTKLKYLKVIIDKFDDTQREINVGSMSKRARIDVSDVESSSDLFNKIVEILPNHMEGIHLLIEKDTVIIAPVLEKFNSLRCLTLKKFQLTNTTLEGILKNKDTLAKLDLSGCEFPTDALSLFPNLKKLTHLILWEIKNFDANEIISIGKNCEKLEHIEFKNLETNSGSLKKVPYHIFRKLTCLNLKHLHFHGIDKSRDYDGNLISNTANNKWKELKYLNIEEEHSYSISDIYKIMKFKNLEFLNIYFANVDSQFFPDIINHCLELKELIMTHLPKSYHVKLKKLKKLEKLDLSYCKRFSKNLLSNCKNLIDLNISFCHYFTENLFSQVGELRYLKRLNIRYILNVPNAIFDNLYELEELRCRGCSSITDEGMIKVLDNCKKLSYLEVCATGITIKTLVHASKREFVLKPLEIWIDSSVINNTTSVSPYVNICSKY